MSVSKAAHDDDISQCRADFPCLQQEIQAHPLVYLDSAASAQMPAAVIDAVSNYQSRDHANVHRGVHTLSHRATEAFENAREQTRAFIGARSSNEIIFTRGTTESINLVAHSFLRPRLQAGDQVLITYLEHHSNIVPWQLVCEESGAELVAAPINESGELLLDDLFELLTERVKLLAIGHVSNALGTINPLETIIARARDNGIPVLVDGAQAVPHMHVDVQALDCDFYAFSGHKMFAPTGIGVLYGRETLLEAMPPWQGGGDMILEVSFAGTTFNSLPYKFEAGTPNISGAVGLAAAMQYLDSVGLDKIARHEAGLLAYMTARLGEVEGLTLVGTARQKASVQSFVMDGIHSHDLGTILDHQGVAIRTGHHCAMPVMAFFKLSGTARASLALYNNEDDIDRLIDAIVVAKRMFG
jgi:cysteine desulfurase/selenocysteine lyase